MRDCLFIGANAPQAFPSRRAMRRKSNICSFWGMRDQWQSQKRSGSQDSQTARRSCGRISPQNHCIPAANLPASMVNYNCDLARMRKNRAAPDVFRKKYCRCSNIAMRKSLILTVDITDEASHARQHGLASMAILYHTNVLLSSTFPNFCSF